METGFSFARTVPAPPDRRQNERHIKILRVGTLISEAGRELCLIRNISAGGLMAHVYSQLAIGQRVSVELKTRQPVSGHVVWVRESNAGVQFDDMMDVAELLSNPAVLDDGWRPRTPRVEIDRMATLRADGKTWWVHARDISQSGVRIEGEQPPPVGADVVISLEGFRPFAGVVRWTDDGNCGIAFNGMIPFGELIQWLKADG